MDAASARVGTQINAKWTIDAYLGSGGMATVFAATHRNGSRAALKVLHAEFARDEAIRTRFLREGKIANKIDHPSVVQISDDDLSDLGEAFLVMELLEGETLEHRLREKGTLSFEEIFQVFDPIVDLLGNAHDVEIIHRDLKPENIFLTHSGDVKVLDFGIARFREESSRADATRQGTALGTPSFMAPEQALGLGDLVDGRADLFSVGACMFTALSGQRLHQARAENEAFVLAATKAAPSLATVAPELPVEIVAFVDKALSYERNSRFADARAMRGELRALWVAWQSGKLTSPTKRGGGLVVRGDEFSEEDEVGSTESKAHLVKRIKNIWKLLGMFVASTRQYGWDHPESGRHLQTAYAETLEALAAFPESVRWDVTPYAFLYDGTPVWEPDRPPFDRMPFQLFADGLRKVQLKAGIAEQELRDLVAVLMRDSSTGAASEDDAITSLWDRHFEHVAYLAIDSFAEGDAEDRDAFEKECADLAKQALELARIHKDWDESSLEASAKQINFAAVAQEASESAAALALDPPTRAALAAQLVQSSERWTERYVEAFVQGYLEGLVSGDVALLLEALREWTSDQITLRNYPLAFGMFSTIADTFDLVDPDNASIHHTQIARAMFPDGSLGVIIRKLSEEPTKAPEPQEAGSGSDREGLLVSGLKRMLDLLDDASLVTLARDRLEYCLDTPLGSVLLSYLGRWARGHEEAVGAKLDSCRAETALVLIPMLAELGTKEAGSALSVAFRHAKAEVRLEALSRLPDTAAEELNESLLFLLEDAEEAVRKEALRNVSRLKLKAIGPALVRFIGSPAFQLRTIDERKAWLATLASLNPARAESLAIEILSGWTMIPKAEREQTRVAAAEVLAEFGSRHVLDAVRAAAKKRWWNTVPVREAAERAVQAIEERATATGNRASSLPEGER